MMPKKLEQMMLLASLQQVVVDAARAMVASLSTKLTH
jgi:hypothetical protein